jgi:hypothetical protein
MQYFTNWLRFQQARSFLLSCVPYKELICITGHLDVAKTTWSTLTILPATAFLFINRSSHITAAWTTPLSLVSNSYNRLIRRGAQLHLGTKAWHIRFNATLTTQPYEYHRLSYSIWIFIREVTGSCLDHFSGILTGDFIFINLDLDHTD